MIFPLIFSKLDKFPYPDVFPEWYDSEEDEE